MAHTVVKYVDGMQFIGHGKSGHAVIMDSAEKVGGADSAARPLEVLLCALGGCSGMDVVSILGKMRTPPSRFSIEIDDERAPDYPKAITKLHLVYRISGDVPEENVKKAIDLSLSKYCPVANSLAGVAEITSEYVIE
jgi:putative redox protein